MASIEILKLQLRTPISGPLHLQGGEINVASDGMTSAHGDSAIIAATTSFVATLQPLLLSSSSSLFLCFHNFWRLREWRCSLLCRLSRCCAWIFSSSLCMTSLWFRARFTFSHFLMSHLVNGFFFIWLSFNWRETTGWSAFFSNSQHNVRIYSSYLN